MMTKYGVEITERMAGNYLDALVDRFYKILPMTESGEETLKQYLESLLREMLGAHELVEFLQDDDRFLTLLATLQYFIDNDADNDAAVAIVRTDVFRSIGILKKLKKKYFAGRG